MSDYLETVAHNFHILLLYQELVDFRKKNEQSSTKLNSLALNQTDSLMVIWSFFCPEAKINLSWKKLATDMTLKYLNFEYYLSHAFRRITSLIFAYFFFLVREHKSILVHRANKVHCALKIKIIKKESEET